VMLGTALLPGLLVRFPRRGAAPGIDAAAPPETGGAGDPKP